jgi:hypothetical protein
METEIVAKHYNRELCSTIDPFKMAEMPTYTWNKTLEAKSRHRIEGIMSSHLLRMQSLDVHELHSDTIAFQRTYE